MVVNSAPRGGSIAAAQNWVRRHKTADLLQVRRRETERGKDDEEHEPNTRLVMVTVNTLPPILHPHLSSVLKSAMIKSRFIDCVTWKNLQSLSQPNRFWFLDRKRGVLGISKRVCCARMNLDDRKRYDRCERVISLLQTVKGSCREMLLLNAAAPEPHPGGSWVVEYGCTCVFAHLLAATQHVKNAPDTLKWGGGVNRVLLLGLF